MTTTNEQNLIYFAKRVLAILDKEEHWNSDTTDDIATEALNLKLAKITRSGRFRTEKGNQ